MLNTQLFENAQLRFADFYLGKLKSFKEQYQSGGDISFTALRLSENDWSQIQQARGWTVKNQTSQVVSQLCSDYAIAGSELLHFHELPMYRLRWFEEALSAAQRIDDQIAISHHLLYIGITYFDLGQLVEAELQIERVLANEENSHEVSLKAQALCQLGKVQVDLGKIDLAGENLRASISLFENLNDIRGVAESLHHLGMVMGKLAQFQEAQEYYQQSLNIFKQHNHHFAMTTPIMQLARLALLQNEPEIALEYLEEALAIRRGFNYQQAIADTLKDIGYIYYVNEDFDKAEVYYQEALATTVKLGNKLKLANAYNYLADLRFEQQRYEEALNFYQKGLAVCQEFEHPYGQINTLGSIATTHHKLGQIDSAMQAFIQSFETALNYEATPYILDVLAWLADVLVELEEANLARHIATFLRDYERSLPYIQSAAAEILEGLPPTDTPSKTIPTDHIALTQEILSDLARIATQTS